MENKIPELEVYEFKEIHALNFKCDLCRKTYTTEGGVQKHIGRQHPLEEKIGLNYSSFVGKKKVKVLADKKFSFKCSMCDKILLSREGIEIHLKTFHGVAIETLTDLYSSVLNPNTSIRQFKVFVPPMKVSEGVPGNKDWVGSDRHEQFSEGDHCPNHKVADIRVHLDDSDQPQSDSHRGVKNTNGCSDKTGDREGLEHHPVEMGLNRPPDLVIPRADLPGETLGTVSVKKHSTCVKKIVKKPKQRIAKPSKIKKTSSFCKELTNMFVSGTIQVEKFNMGGKIKSISHTVSLSDATPLSQAASGVPLSHGPTQTSSVHLNPVPTQSATVTNASLPDAVGVPHVGVAHVGVPHIGVPHALPLPLASPEESSGWINPFAYAGMTVPVVEKGTKRKRKTCGDYNCGPCSVQEDCVSCRYCLHKKLK